MADEITDDTMINLSPREAEILALTRAGKRSKEIAAELGIALNTVHAHRRNMIEKASARSMLQVIAAIDSAATLDGQTVPAK